MDWQLKKSQRAGWHEYRLLLDGEEVAFAKWRLHIKDAIVADPSAELHNTISLTTRTVLVKAREVFHAGIMADIREAGAKFIVVADTEQRVTSTMSHYWRFMGFKFECGDNYGCRCAVMEVA